jgi:hypothetical protein
MNSEFLPEADEEFREAVLYYENEAPGVGLRFVAEVRRGVTFITENPFAAVDVGSGIRRKVLNHFPYSLLYAVESCPKSGSAPGNYLNRLLKVLRKDQILRLNQSFWHQNGRSKNLTSSVHIKFPLFSFVPETF